MIITDSISTFIVGDDLQAINEYKPNHLFIGVIGNVSPTHYLTINQVKALINHLQKVLDYAGVGTA